MKRSFSEFFTQRTLPQQRQKLLLVLCNPIHFCSYSSGEMCNIHAQQDEAKLSSLHDMGCLFGEPDIENYYQLSSSKKQLDVDCQKTIMSSKVAQAVRVKRRLQALNRTNGVGVCVFPPC